MMTSVAYLLLALPIALVVGSCFLISAVRQADEGYETSFGFRRGALPTVIGASNETAPPMRMRASTSSTAPMLVPVAAVMAPAAGTISPLYRRHRRRNHSRPPMPAVSASPFELQCAATRERANEVNSTPPLDVSTKAIIANVLGQDSVS